MIATRMSAGWLKVRFRRGLNLTWFSATERFLPLNRTT